MNVQFSLRKQVEAEIERLLAVLDAIDGDPDMEPSLGSVENHPNPYFDGYDAAGIQRSQEDWAFGNTDEREDDCEDEGAQCDDEGHQESGISDLDGLKEQVGSLLHGRFVGYGEVL